MPTKDQLEALEAELVAHGWPGRGSRIGEQHSHPVVEPALVKRFAPDEQQIVLLAPPFTTVANDAKCNPDLWRDFGALDQLVPDEAVLIADFGLGSDASVVVDFRTAPARVLRLEWGVHGNRWVEVAESVNGLLTLLEMAR